MRDEIGTTNQNWMDENYQNKNDQKLDNNFGLGLPQHEFFRPEDYFMKDNIPMLNQPGIYYGGYEYHPHPLYYDNMFAIDKEMMPPFQMLPPINEDIIYDHHEAIPYCNPDAESVLKLYKQDLHMGYWHQNMMHNPAQNLQALLMTRQFAQRPSHHYPIQKIVKQQQPFSLKNQQDQSKTKVRTPYPLFANIYEIAPSPSQSVQRGPTQPRLIGGITMQQRRAKIKLYQEKRNRRTYVKKVSYDCRKKVADQRIRIKGRFVTKKQAQSMLEGQEPIGFEDYQQKPISGVSIKSRCNKECGEVKIQ